MAHHGLRPRLEAPIRWFKDGSNGAGAEGFNGVDQVQVDWGRGIGRDPRILLRCIPLLRHEDCCEGMSGERTDFPLLCMVAFW